MEKVPNTENQDPMQKHREFCEAMYNELELGRSQTAKELFDRLKGAINFLEVGLRLGRENPEHAEELIQEIKERLEQRKRQLEEQLYPSSRKK